MTSNASRQSQHIRGNDPSFTGSLPPPRRRNHTAPQSVVGANSQQGSAGGRDSPFAPPLTSTDPGRVGAPTQDSSLTEIPSSEDRQHILVEEAHPQDETSLPGRVKPPSFHSLPVETRPSPAHKSRAMVSDDDRYAAANVAAYEHDAALGQRVELPPGTTQHLRQYVAEQRLHAQTGDFADPHTSFDRTLEASTLR